MADRVKIAPLRPSAAALTDLYVCPANYMFAGQLMIVNDTAGPIAGRVSLADDGAPDNANQYIVGGNAGNGYAIEGGGAPVTITGIVLGPGDVIRVYSTTAGLVFTLNGIERNI